MGQVADDVNSLLGGCHSALLLDETAILKKGKYLVGVGRQWCAWLSKVENCQVGIFSPLAKDSDACLIGTELYVPESWKEDPARCDKAWIPADKRTSRSKLVIALTLVKRAKANGVAYGWVGADDFYVQDSDFQQTLHTLGETFKVDVPKNFRIYRDDPRPYLPYRPRPSACSWRSYANIRRDYEYKRHSTLTLVAGLGDRFMA